MFQEKLGVSGVFYHVERGVDEEQGEDADHREHAKDISPVQMDHVWEPEHVQK